LTEGFAKGAGGTISIDDVAKAAGVTESYVPAYAAGGGDEARGNWATADTAKWATQCAWAATTTSLLMEAVEAGVADIADARRAAEAAIKAAAHTGRASSFAAPKGRMHLIDQARRNDFEQLLGVTKRRAPDLGDPINIDLLGPLWPEKKSGWLRWFS
jgi:hypothetical protein